MSTTDCLFCKIVEGTLPSLKVYETEHLYAFLDIKPAHRGHTLLVPKTHCRDIFDAAHGQDARLGEEVLRTMQRLAAALKEVTGCPGINIIQNNGSAAGQTVFHLHWHIIPRFENDGIPAWPQKKYESQAAMNDMAETLRNALSCTN